MTSAWSLTLNDAQPHVIGSFIRDARVAIGWSQDELADRAKTSQTMIWRMEAGDPRAFQLVTVARVLTALGARWELGVKARHLPERTQQLDPVHASMLGALAGRLARAGWHVETEVPTGGEAPTGWIDLAAFRPADAAMFLGEIKADLPDVGGAQRQVGWAEHSAGRIAARFGWRPRTTRVALVCLDTAAIAERLLVNRELLRRAFPGDPSRFIAWLAGAEAVLPTGRTIVVTDLAAHRGLGMRPSRVTGRARRAAYEGYADAAAVISGRRPRGGQTRRQP